MGRSYVQNYLQLHNEFEDSLGYRKSRILKSQQQQHHQRKKDLETERTRQWEADRTLGATRCQQKQGKNLSLEPSKLTSWFQTFGHQKHENACHFFNPQLWISLLKQMNTAPNIHKIDPQYNTTTHPSFLPSFPLSFIFPFYYVLLCAYFYILKL